MRLLVLVTAAMCADLLTFALVEPLVGGIGVESNPAMVHAFTTFGLAGIVVLKVALTLVILALVARGRDDRPLFRWKVTAARKRRIAATVGVVLGLVGTASNVAAFVRWQA